MSATVQAVIDDILEFMRIRGMSQGQTARYLGLKQPSLSRILNGQQIPGTRMIEKIRIRLPAATQPDIPLNRRIELDKSLPDSQRHAILHILEGDYLDAARLLLDMIEAESAKKPRR